MTLPDERYRSLLYARDFLYRLLDTKERPKTVRELKRQASAVLRHFPAEYELEEIAKNSPRLLKRGVK